MIRDQGTVSFIDDPVGTMGTDFEPCKCNTTAERCKAAWHYHVASPSSGPHVPENRKARRAREAKERRAVR